MSTTKTKARSKPHRVSSEDSILAIFADGPLSHADFMDEVEARHVDATKAHETVKALIRDGRLESDGHDSVGLTGDVVNPVPCRNIGQFPAANGADSLSRLMDAIRSMSSAADDDEDSDENLDVDPC